VVNWQAVGTSKKSSFNKKNHLQETHKQRGLDSMVAQDYQYNPLPWKTPAIPSLFSMIFFPETQFYSFIVTFLSVTTQTFFKPMFLKS
jgi:hypothetical protein